MQDLKYHVVMPENKKDTYGEYETIDFKTSALGRKLVGGTVRLLGQINVNTFNPDDDVVINDTVYYDGMTGLHVVVDNIKTSFSNVGLIENLDHYSRYVSSKSKASLTKNDLFNSVYVCEGRAPDYQLTQKLLYGVLNQEDKFKSYQDFSCKLDFCLNNLIGDVLLPFSKTGDILVSLQTSKVVQALYGDSNLGGNKNYTLSNIRLVYSSVADDGKYSKYAMRVKSSLKQSLQSTYANISTKIPIVADSFFMTFIEQADENQPLSNSMALQKIPLFQKLEITWNDSLSQQYQYQIDNEEEILVNFVKAVQKVSGDNSCSLSTLSGNDGYGMGLQFGSFVDLSKTKLGVNIQSGISSDNPFTVYMFFNGVVSL